jgi:hypothetical protein
MSHVSKPTLVAVNGAAALLLLAMRDLDSTTRLLVGAALAVNLVLLIGRSALLTRPARLGAGASLVGYAGTVVSWLVLAFGCGIEYYNARCDAVVTPLIVVFMILSLAGLPTGRLCGAFAKHDT